MKHKKKIWLYTVFLLLVFVLLPGCGKSKESNVKVGNEVNSGLVSREEKQEKEEQKEKEEEIKEEKEIIYAILQMNEEEHSVRLQNVETGKISEYGISDATAFRDKYGDFTGSNNMAPGRLVKIGSENAAGKLSYLQITDEGWEQEDVKKFSINPEIGMITVGRTKYQYDDNLLVFLNGEQISLDMITESDNLRVAGVDKRIASIFVTRGHGFLALTHTENFEGGWLSVGNEYVLKIEKDLKVEVPEGTYQVSAAKDGYGDTKEVAIASNETTVINLEEYKGEGPKLGKVQFKLEPENAVLKIDGQQMDVSQPLELEYGAYQLEVSAENYETLDKKLVVGAKEAELTIKLEGTGGKGQSSGTSGSSSGGTSPSNKPSSSSGNSSSGKTSSSSGTTSSGGKKSSGTTSSSGGTSSSDSKNSTSNNSKKKKDTTDSKDDKSTDNEKLLQKLSDFISTLLD